MSQLEADVHTIEGFSLDNSYRTKKYMGVLEQIDDRHVHPCVRGGRPGKCVILLCEISLTCKISFESRNDLCFCIYS